MTFPLFYAPGINEQISQENAQSLGIQSLIMKPVGMQQLAETIRNVLMPVSTERRKNPRFGAPAGTFVISRTHPYERFSLVDIGVSGLAYSHEMESVPGHPSDQLAIMTPDGEILVSGIRCKSVSDIPADSSSPRLPPPRSGPGPSRCALRGPDHASDRTDRSVHPKLRHRTITLIRLADRIPVQRPPRRYPWRPPPCGRRRHRASSKY